MSAGAHHRIRHGVVFDPIFGYRAVVEIDGQRQWIGKWTNEAEAQANADTSVQAWRSAVDAHGATRQAGDTPLDIWVPAGQAGDR